jgi:hypothetical protein
MIMSSPESWLIAVSLVLVFDKLGVHEDVSSIL